MEKGPIELTPWYVIAIIDREVNSDEEASLAKLNISIVAHDDGHTAITGHHTTATIALAVVAHFVTIEAAIKTPDRKYEITEVRAWPKDQVF